MINIVAFDYETLRRNRVNEQARDMSDWDKAAAEQVERDREAYARSREEELHKRDCATYGLFCDRMSERERDQGQADRAKDWTTAANDNSKSRNPARPRGVGGPVRPPVDRREVGFPGRGRELTADS